MSLAQPGSLANLLPRKLQPSGRSRLLDLSRLHPAEALVWIAAIGAFFLFPEDLSFATSILVMILFVLSLDLILGYAGVISMGHALFFGVGAYTAGLIALAGWQEPISGALLGTAAGALAAFVTGLFVLRLRDLPLIMVTLALGVIGFEIGNKATWLTHGDDGLVGIELQPILGLFKWSFYSDTSYLYALAWLFLAFIVARRLVASPFGMAVQGIRENRRRMALLGAPVFGHLLRIYVIGGALAGLAGALSAQTTKFVSLNALSLDMSISAVVMLVVGGVGRLYGAVVGTVVYMVVQHVAAQWNPYHWMFVIGTLLVLIVMFARGGVLGLADDIIRRLRRQTGGA
jgi:branched-chain amino acid transport system permease protein